MGTVAEAPMPTGYSHEEIESRAWLYPPEQREAIVASWFAWCAAGRPEVWPPPEVPLDVARAKSVAAAVKASTGVVIRPPKRVSVQNPYSPTSQDAPRGRETARGAFEGSEDAKPGITAPISATDPKDETLAHRVTVRLRNIGSRKDRPSQSKERVAERQRRHRARERALRNEKS